MRVSVTFVCVFVFVCGCVSRAESPLLCVYIFVVCATVCVRVCVRVYMHVQMFCVRVCAFHVGSLCSGSIPVAVLIVF